MIQLRLSTTTREQAARCWAFAVDQGKTRRKSMRTTRKCIITAASYEARKLGVQVGMACDDAKLLLPELKVFVCNWR